VASDIHSRRGQDQNPRAAVQPAAVTKGTPSQKKQDPEEGQQQQEQEQVAYRVPPYRQLHHTVLLNGLHRAQSLRETSVGGCSVSHCCCCCSGSQMLLAVVACSNCSECCAVSRLIACVTVTATAVISTAVSLQCCTQVLHSSE
jgi:hypothetical protein